MAGLDQRGTRAARWTLPGWLLLSAGFFLYTTFLAESFLPFAVEWDEVVETGQRLDREHAAAEIVHREAGASQACTSRTSREPARSHRLADCFSRLLSGFCLPALSHAKNCR